MEDCELKLPYISDVNDVFDCSPYFYIENNYEKMKARYLTAFKRKKIPIPHDFDTKFRAQFNDGSLFNCFKYGSEDEFRKRSEKSVLICVSKNPLNFLMWAHYAEQHKGLVIEFDFQNILIENSLGSAGIKMFPVDYRNERPIIDVLIDPDTKEWSDQFNDFPLVKSLDWKYEDEYRTVSAPETLLEFEKYGLVCQKDYDHKKHWFLKINPSSVKSIILGLHSDKFLEQKIINLCKNPFFQHLKINKIQASESEFRFAQVTIN